MQPMVKLLAILLVCVISACTLTRGSSVLLGTSRSAIDPAQVELYTELPASYEKIALLTADSRNDFASQQNLSNAAIERLKKEAAKLGANGILLDGIGNYQVGTTGVITANTTGSFTAGTIGGVTRTGKAATGIAIFVSAD